MIRTIENFLYEFLAEKLKDKNINLYRGVLPEQRHSDREEGKKISDLFPFVLLRLTEFKQIRTGIDSYDVPVDFEIWIGTKMEEEKDYLKNLDIGDYLKKEFLKQSTVDKKFAVDQSYPFSVEFFNDESYPFFYSVCRFKVFGIPDTSEIISNDIKRFLGRS